MSSQEKSLGDDGCPVIPDAQPRGDSQRQRKGFILSRASHLNASLHTLGPFFQGELGKEPQEVFEEKKEGLPNLEPLLCREVDLFFLVFFLPKALLYLEEEPMDHTLELEQGRPAG